MLESLQRTHQCAILFVFEERADKFPSEGFFEELRSRFELLVPPDLPPSIREKHPRLEFYWLRLHCA